MLSLSLLPYPDIDPVLIAVGPVAIRWYALAYLAGILLGYGWIKRLNRTLSPPLLSQKQLDDLIVWAVIGIILGGRLGYVFFYNAPYYLEHPLEIPAVWRGGMAFHGGLLGVIAAFYLFAQRQKLPYLRLMDLIACAAPIGLFFGRLANFINGELYGRVSDCAICMIFPSGGALPRHPSQLYEAMLEGAALFTVLALFWRFSSLKSKPGRLSGVFLVGYALARGSVEWFREPDTQLGLLLYGFSMGQLLSLPMLLLGLYLLLRSVKEKSIK